MAEIDVAELRRAVAGPGADPRQWVSFATVNPDTPDARSVIFTDENGAPLPTGPLVSVTLHPSGMVAACRVAGAVAGVEEADWVPFVANDEVIVVIPEGNERAGCTIIGRLNQSLDTFPLTVGGMDVTKNTFAFRRIRTPYVLETAASYSVRSALTGAAFTIDQNGNIIQVSGDGHQLVLHGSFLKFGEKSDAAFLQIDPSTKEVLLQAGDTTQLILSKSTSQFLTTGTLNIGTSGFAGLGHAVTLEQVCGLILNFVCALASLGAFDGPGLALTPTNPFGNTTNPGGSWAAGSVAALTSLVTAVFPAAVAPSPIGAGGLPGGVLDATGLSPALLLALQAQLPDPAGLGLPTPFMPGIARSGLFL